MSAAPDAAPGDDGRPRHRELGSAPVAPRRIVSERSRRGLMPGEVPARLDRQGQPLEAVRPESQEAADHWDERVWHPTGGTR